MGQEAVVDKLSEITRSDPVSLPTSHGVGANNIDRFLAQCRPETPCLVIDLDIVRAQYHALRAVFPNARIFYAVKANPAAEVIAALAELGCIRSGECRRDSPLTNAGR